MRKIYIVELKPTEAGFNFYMVYGEDRKIIKFWDEENYGDDENAHSIDSLKRWLRENKEKIEIVEFRIVGVKNAEMHYQYEDEIFNLQIPVENKTQIWMDEENPVELIIREYLS